MMSLKGFIITGILMVGLIIEVNFLPFNQAKMTTVQYPNGLKEEIYFNNGQTKIFRTFDQHGNQILGNGFSSEFVK